MCCSTLLGFIWLSSSNLSQRGQTHFGGNATSAEEPNFVDDGTEVVAKDCCGGNTTSVKVCDSSDNEFEFAATDGSKTDGGNVTASDDGVGIA